MALTAQNRCQIGERNRCHRVRVRVEIDQNDIHGGSIVAEHPLRRIRFFSRSAPRTRVSESC